LNKKDTCLIVYPPGGYGNFINWCLDYFTEKNPDHVIPFLLDGSSHYDYSNHNETVRKHSIGFAGAQTTIEYYNSDCNYPIVKTHGHENAYRIKNWTVQYYINPIQDYTRQFIIMNPGADSMLMVLNNMLTKTEYALDTQVINYFTSSFAIEKTPVPTWQLREMYSFWVDGAAQFFVNGYAPIKDPKIVNISIRQLVDNFQPTLKLAFDQLGLVMSRQQQLSGLEDKWLSLQKYSNIDFLCNQIVDATVNNQFFDWSGQKLSTLSEGYIQWQLRDLHKLDLLCYNLNVFPTNSVELRKLLINV
jgi:hypothetical protein